MSIVDDTFKRLGDEHSRRGGNPAFRQPAVDPLPEICFSAGSRKRRPALLIALVLAAACVAAYVMLHRAQSPSMAPQTQAAVAEASPKQPVAAKAVTQESIQQPSWYEAGWNAAGAGKWPDAFLAWEDGLGKLPGDRMVIAASSYADLKVFSSVLRKYVRIFPAIGVRQHYNGKMVYRLVVYPYGGASKKVLPKVQSLFSHAALVHASYMQARLADSSGARVTREKVAMKAEDGVMPRPMRGNIEPANSAQPIVVEGAHLSKASRMSFENTNKALNESGGTSAPAEANEWVYRSRTVRIQLEEEAYTEAAGNAQALTREFPDRWEPWFWLGTEQLAQGQLDAAAAALEQAGKLNPKVAQIWVQRAVVEQERGAHAAAVRLLTEARGLSPKSPQVYLNLGYSNDALGLSAEAERNYQYFLTLTEGDVAYLLQRTLVIERLERKQ